MNIRGLRVVLAEGEDVARRADASQGAFWRHRRYVATDSAPSSMLLGEPAASTEVSQLATEQVAGDVQYYCEMFEPGAEGVADLPDGTADLPYLLAVGWTPRDGTYDDYHAWFWEEHKPDLLAIPGWEQVRRFVRVGGKGPEYFAIHYLRALDVFQHPLYEQMQKSRWRDRVMADRIAHSRFLGRQVRA